MADITQKLGFDASSAIASLRSLSDGLNQANANMRNLANSSREFISKTQGMSAALAAMGRNAQSISKMLTQLGYNAKITGTSLAAVGNAGKSGFAAAMQRFDALAAKAKATAAAAAAAAAKAQAAPVAGGASPLTAMRSALDGLANINVFGLLQQGVQLFTRYLWPAVDAARELGLAIAEIQTIAQGTGMNADQLTAAVIRLSNEMGKPAKDVAEGLYEVLSNQVVDAKDAVGFLAEAQKLAITTHASTAEAVDALASVMNSYSLQAHEAARVSDQLFETVFIGRVRLGDIADRIGRITPMAAQMGVRFEEVGAAIAVMTVQGVKGDTAITQLRAIMSKLMKPTEELQKVFRSWGVQDGPAALKAFGGIYGVLQKLSKEVGGSSSEMSEFFNVVRAMTGVMSVGTDEGERFRAAIAALEGSTGKAAEAWEIFNAAPAQRLTQALNETKNELIALGMAIGPVVSWWLEGFNSLFQGLGQAWEAWGAFWSDTKYAEAIATRLEAIRVDAVKNAHKESSKFDNKYWRDRETAYRAHIAEMNAATTGASAGLIARQSAANEVLKGAGETLMGEFEKSYKHLTDFVNDGAKRLEDSLKIIANLRKSAADIRFDIQLDKARSPAQKLNLLMGDFNNKLTEARKLSAGVGVDPEKLKEAMAVYDTAFKASEREAAYRAETGDESGEYRARERGAQILEEQIRLQEQVNAAQASRAPLAAKELASLEARKATTIELYKKQQELLFKQGAGAGARTEKQAELLQQEINSVTQQLADSMKGLELSQTILDSLGIETTVEEFGAAFANKMADITIDWAVQTASLEAALEELQVQLMVDLQVDPSMIQKLQGTVLERMVGEGVAEWLNRIMDATTEAGDKLSEANNKLRESDIEADSAKSKISNEVEKRAGAAAKLGTQLREDAKTTVSLWGQMFNLNIAQDFSDMWHGTSVEARLATGQILTEVESTLGALKLDAMKPGGFTQLGENALAAVAQRVVEAEQAGQLEEGIADSLKRQIQALRDLSNAYKERGTYIEQQADAEKKLEGTESMQRGVLDTKIDISKANELGEKVESNKKDINLLNQASASAVETANLYAVSAEKANNLTGDTAQAQSGMSNAVAQTISYLDGEANAQQRILDLVIATNQARAGGGGGEATAYSGGLINYLAAGGRGQDNIHTVLSRGEYVSSARTAGKFFSELNAMNNGSRPVHRAQGGSVTNVGDVNVTVKGGDSSQQTVREIGHALRREIQRGNIKLK